MIPKRRTGSRRRVNRGSLAAAALLLAFAARAAPLSAQSQQTDSLIDRAARILASGRSLRANFDQTLTNPDTKVVRTSHGDFIQQGPSKFAFRFTDPAGPFQTAVGSGRRQSGTCL